ncbi:LamG domain-containing protein [Pleionea sediminis]|uniref:LamG domain-containing protein n=1 Tax=Pleionea sediminis TaxID=2569479 RepID=UPI0011869569|nr:LamG domain-containing protein [Pleionea sediminis]
MSSKKSVSLLLAFGLSLLSMSSAYSVGGFNEWRTKQGFVMARGLVLTEDGYPMFAEYDEEGNIVVEQVAIRDPSMEDAYVISGDEYRMVADYYKNFVQENEDGIARGAEIISADDYDSRAFQTIDGKPLDESAKAELMPNTKSVLIRNQNQIFIPTTDPALLQANINLQNLDEEITNGNTIKSVLLDKDGNVVHKTENNIGLKVRYFEGESEDNFRPGRDDKIYDPLELVPLIMPDGLVGGSTATGNDGRYSSLYMLPPCPGFTYEHYTPITLRLYYENFNPRLQNGMGLYHLTKPGWDYCSGLSALIPPTSLGAISARLAIESIEASATTFLYDTNFFVDTAVIGGEAFLSNERLDGPASGEETPIPLGPTRYKYEEPDLDPHDDYKFDFDGDGEDDVARLGALDTITVEGDEIEVFEQNNTGPLQGIFLSSGSQDPDSRDRDKRQPDFVRLADKMPDLQDQGLLEYISEDDFKDTDILVFRESNGMLITKREGLAENEFRTRAFTELDSAAGEMAYSIMVRGPKSAPYDYTDRANRTGLDWYSAWQSAAEMNPKLHERKSDHIRPQEKIRVIAINRKTGYMGSVRTTYGKFITDGFISMNIDKIVMRPPNLKIIAERKYTVEKGLTANQGEDSEREYLIGYEGAALASDRVITITTEWFDHDGSPLPEELDEYGYTGRLAKIVAENTVDQDSGALANFKIKPGRHTENIQIGDDPERNEHYYVQVHPEPISESPDFSTTGAAPTGPLRYRPQNYVPIKAPIMDETMTWEQYRAYRDYRRENPEADVEKPEPVYKWFYRPELQFSLYGLEMQNIFRVDESEGLSVDVYQQEKPVIASSDDLIRIVYSLFEQEIQPLQFLGAGQELVFAVGEEEVKAFPGEDGQLRFENLDHLSSLDVEDFLSARLYSNNDAGNILWEYAFEYLVLDSRIVGYDDVEIDENTGRAKYYISADEPEFPLISYLVGYAGRDQEDQYPVELEWSVDGGAQIINQSNEYRENAVFSADVKMPTFTNATATVKAKIAGTQTEAEFGELVVVPGKPDFMNVNMSGDAYIVGHKGIDVTIDVFDQHGNKVADGTSVELTVKGSADILEYDPGTVDGRITARIVGSNKPEADNTLTIIAGELEEERNFEIKPLNIAFVNLPAEEEVQKVLPLSVQVTEPGGETVSGVDVSFFAQGVKIDDKPVQTNGSGIAIKKMHTGFNPRTAEVYARVGLVGEKMPFRTTPAGGGNSSVDASKAMVIGDEEIAGYYEYERFDGAILGLKYETETPITLTGEAGESVTVNLGSLADPNRTPIAAFYMKSLDANSEGQEVARDETGIHPNVAYDIVIADEHPTEVSKSYLFSGDSSIVVDENDALKPANSLGFSVQVKPTENNGEVFRLGNGNQKLAINGNGEPVFSIITESGQYSITGPTLSDNSWSTIAGRYYNGLLELEINGTPVTPVAAVGQLEYGAFRAVMTVGKDFKGYMSSFKLFDWSLPALLTFDNGAETYTHNFTSNESVDVIIKSTGQLNEGVTNLNIRSMKVALVENNITQFVGILSKEYYGELSGFMATMQSDADIPIKPGAYTGGPPDQAYDMGMVPYAYAGWTDWILEEAWELVVDVVGFLIPWEEAAGFVKQLWYLVTGDDDFDAFELALNALGVLTFFPVAKPLKFLLNPIRKLYHAVKGKPFIGAFGDVMAKIADDLMEGKFNKLLNTLPFLIIIGEMALDEEAREGALQIINGIESADDFFGWVEYFSLPAGGWTEDTPPEVDLENSAYNYNKSLFLPTAFAGVKKPKIQGAKFGKVVKESVEKLGDEFDAKALTKAIKTIGQEMRQGGFKSLRKMIFSKQMIIAGAQLAKGNLAFLKNFLAGKTGARIPPPIMIAIVFYLETSMANESLADVDGRLHNSIRSVYGDAFTCFCRNSQRKNQTGKSHGGMYQLAVIARYHLENQLGSNKSIKAVEATRKVNLYYDESGLGEEVYGDRERRVDLVLQDNNSKEEWVELKSYKKGTTRISSRFAVWNGRSSRSTPGKEIILDRIGLLRSTEGGVTNDDIEGSPTVRVSKITWLFQKFRVAARRVSGRSYEEERSYTQAEFGTNGLQEGKVLFHLSKVSSTNQVILNSLGFDKASENDPFRRSEIQTIARLDNVTGWLKENARESILKGIEDFGEELTQ